MDLKSHTDSDALSESSEEEVPPPKPKARGKASPNKIECGKCGKNVSEKTLKYSHPYTCSVAKKERAETAERLGVVDARVKRRTDRMVKLASKIA